MSAATATAAPKLSAWLRTAARAGTMPNTNDIAARFGCGKSQASRMLRELEANGDIRIDRTMPNRPKIIVVAP